ncbi:MAG: 2'-5' RNA ligase family protein [Nitrosarchaeum sp.]|nr:2'-5' RNA ligase family protein [Nitrosarchaeum sp.]
MKNMGHYLIEFRFHGYAKKYARTVIYDVARKFNVKGVTRKRAVPHITLYGPFTTRNERQVVSIVANIGRKYNLVPFKVKGFNHFNNWANKVIYLDIEPSNKLENFRWELSQALRPITNTVSTFDKDKQFSFHSTIAFKDINSKFSKIKEYIQSKEEPNINQHLLRVTILRNGKILYEYDLIQKRLLNRRDARSKFHWQKTIQQFKSMNVGTQDEIETEDDFEEENDDKSLWKKIKLLFGLNKK